MYEYDTRSLLLISRIDKSPYPYPKVGPPFREFCIAHSFYFNKNLSLWVNEKIKDAAEWSTFRVQFSGLYQVRGVKPPILLLN